jgi:ubiquinol-cytochrome c reductase iron-sulfur subunit
MKPANFLYAATGGVLLLTVAAGVYFLFQTMSPSADIPSGPRNTVYTLSVEGFEPGQVSTYRLDGVLVVVWRRDFEQKVQSLELLGVEIDGNADLLEMVRTSDQIEIEPDLVLHFEWFVESPINTGGYGCIVLSDAGDLGGFYDPCQDVHFDLWGRVRSGSTEADLQILPWNISDDASVITVDVGNAPRLD